MAVEDIWPVDAKKEAIIHELEEHGILLANLAQEVGPEYGDFDLICHIAYDMPPLTRKERADNVKKRNYFTKYGDGGVDISPIGDLMKSEVYHIGKELGIIDAILNAPPTDGLWSDNRTDESQIGATYAELEEAMRFEANSIPEDQLTARQKEVLSIYRRLHQTNRHKMDPIPVIKIPESLR